MSDLADDLRTRYECTAGFTRDIYMPEQRDLDLLAADELERLRAVRKTLGDANEEADAEIERLRAALEEIAEGKGAYSMDPLEHAGNCIDDMKELARKALNPDD